MVDTSVTITPLPPMQRLSLRARDATVLDGAIGTPVPRRIGDTAGRVACLGPDEWLLRSIDPVSVELHEGAAASVVDVSERSVGWLLEGPQARAVLGAGCPLDLERIVPGRATRTIFETVEIVLIKDAEDRYQIECWRSFAEWLGLALRTAAAHP